ncbi:MAG: hypothetical protein Q3972_07375, partial [Corynebacterium sp.]|nr:hypothetical protein [Corynebacterium sp.]
MQSPIERDVSVNLLLTDLYTTVLSTEELPGEKIFADTLDRIFQHHAYGFRELLLVVFVSMELNPDYRATQDFYASKPRSLYELPIRGFLRANQMPHRKSGPLNMAKATQALNETWASRKKDSETAMTVVRLIQTLENDTSENFDCRKNFGLALMRAYVKSKRTVSNLSINCIPNSDPVILHQLCVALIDTVPDGGNTPQRIAALLLEEFHKGWQTGVTVDGSDDSANTTNTTSKKPGDIIESKGPHSKIYEVTVKRFDKNRLEDS